MSDRYGPAARELAAERTVLKGERARLDARIAAVDAAIAALGALEAGDSPADSSTIPAEKSAPVLKSPPLSGTTTDAPASDRGVAAQDRDTEGQIPRVVCPECRRRVGFNKGGQTLRVHRVRPPGKGWCSGGNRQAAALPDPLSTRPAAHGNGDAVHGSASAPHETGPPVHRSQAEPDWSAFDFDRSGNGTKAQAPAGARPPAPGAGAPPSARSPAVAAPGKRGRTVEQMREDGRRGGLKAAVVKRASGRRPWEPTPEQRTAAREAWIARKPTRHVYGALGTHNATIFARVRVEDHWPARARVVEGYEKPEPKPKREKAPRTLGIAGAANGPARPHPPTSAAALALAHATAAALPAPTRPMPAPPSSGTLLAPRKGSHQAAALQAPSKGSDPRPHNHAGDSYAKGLPNKVDEANLPPRRCQACGQVTALNPCIRCGKPL